MVTQMQQITAVRFPNKTIEAVKGLEAILNASSQPIAQGVRVSAEKLPSDSTPTGKQVVIEAVGGDTFHRIAREEGYTINIFTPSFAEAEELAAEVEEAWSVLSYGANNIKAAWIDTSSMRIENNTPEEQRMITATAIFIGTKTQRARA